MSSYSTIYRKTHPENYKKQQEAKIAKYENDEEYRTKMINRVKERYENDPEYRSRMIERAKVRYNTIKQQKLSQTISVS